MGGALMLFVVMRWKGVLLEMWGVGEPCWQNIKFVRPICTPSSKIKRNNWAFPCVSICGNELKRPHLSCLQCPGRRVYYGKMRNVKEGDLLPVKPSTLVMRDDGGWRRNVLKRVLSVIEFVGWF